MSQVDRNGFGRRAPQELRGTSLGKGSRAGRETDRILVEDAYLDEIDPESPLVVLLRDESRPECLFGYCWPLEPGWSADPLQAPYFPATLTAAKIAETLIGGPRPPKDCAPDGITWF